MREVKGTENEADMGTKDLDGPTHPRLLQKLPLKPTQCRRLLGLIATANEFWTFPAQTMIAILVAFVTWVMMDTLRQMRQINTTAPAKTVESGTQSEFNPVDQITIPTNVYCSPGGECYRTSRKCEGLQNVPMNAIRRRRSCMYCVQRNGQ